MNDAGAYRVLLVEDDVMLLECLSILMADEFVVHSCRSGQEALRLLQQHAFHVVCTDFHMPGMSGLELFRAAGAQGTTRRPHFVVLTGNASEVWDNVPDAERETLSVLRKPCSPERVIARIKQIAGGTAA